VWRSASPPRRCASPHEQLNQLGQTTDPQQRQRLLQEHWQTMYRDMESMRGMGWMWNGPMMGPGMMRSAPAPEAKPLPDAGTAGAKLVSSYCVQCHAAPPPTLHTSQEWASVVGRNEPAHGRRYDEDSDAEQRRDADDPRLHAEERTVRTDRLSALRRPAQGHARGHRDPDRRARDQRGARAQPHPARSGLGQEGGPDQGDTTLIQGAGSHAAIEGRCKELRRQIEDTTSDYDREKLRERLAKLAVGVAVIRVGAPSESELKNRKDAFDDAIASTKAAMAKGIVPGGVALLRVVPAPDAEAAKCEGDEATGVRILRQALEAPLRQIAANSGADPGVVADRVRQGQGAFGFDARRSQYVDLIEAGIIDPTKVVRLALENAVSVASVLLLAEATLTEIDESKAEPRTPELM
jgi:hypothetical protein